MIQGIFARGALPALERVVQFTAARQKVLAHNIANLSTPYFKPTDLSPEEFRATLRSAIDQRRGGADPHAAPLEIRDTDQVTFRPDGIAVNPEATHEGVLYHDQNNRDLERIMQHLAENTLMHNAAVEMIRNQFAVLQTAIRERV